MPNLPFSLWLCPTFEDRARLSDQIVQWARAYGGVEFEPHVTLYAGLRPPHVSLTAVLEAGAAARIPRIFRVHGLGFEDHWSRTLYYRLDGEPPDTDVVERLCNLGILGDYVLRPHLSLSYHAALPARVRRALARDHRFPSTLAFDTLAVVEPDAETRDWSDVAQWRVVARRGLPPST